MNKFLSLFATFFLMTVAVTAQQVSGIVKDVDGKAVANATVSLHNAKDTAVIKLGVTDKDGNYKFNAINKGAYMISASYVGYQIKYSPAFEVSGDVTVPVFTLEKSDAELKGVTVVAKKPMIEVMADKTILNVENSINAVGNDALELLRKSPGVMVDKDDNISLSG
ncbi:MAG: carboxypeptidase-like regulatory domain-containing protein, partial [Panacibacter sp.]